MRIAFMLLVLLLPGVASANVCAEQDRRIGSEISRILIGLDRAYMAGELSYLDYDHVRTTLTLQHNNQYVRDLRVAAVRPNAAETCRNLANNAIADIWHYLENY
jgi:hypothetical protein